MWNISVLGQLYTEETGECYIHIPYQHHTHTHTQSCMHTDAVRISYKHKLQQ